MEEREDRGRARQRSMTMKVKNRKRWDGKGVCRARWGGWKWCGVGGQERTKIANKMWIWRGGEIGGFARWKSTQERSEIRGTGRDKRKVTQRKGRGERKGWG
jgi:hypothetical protein